MANDNLVSISLPKNIHYYQQVLDIDLDSDESADINPDDGRNSNYLTQFDPGSRVVMAFDANGNPTALTYDAADRKILERHFDGDPLRSSPVELQHYEWAYDRNSRLTEERAFADVTDLSSVQVTRHAYDNLERRVRTAYPDSDDPIDGRGSGDDGVFDRIEMQYDQNSNLIRLIKQRGVVFDNIYDPGNRLIDQQILRPPSVPGTSRQTLSFDALDRVISARNDFARVDLGFDAFSRLESEMQSIRLDGSGSDRGWESPIHVTSTFDKQSAKDKLTEDLLRKLRKKLGGSPIDLVTVDFTLSFSCVDSCNMKYIPLKEPAPKWEKKGSAMGGEAEAEGVKINLNVDEVYSEPTVSYTAKDDGPRAVLLDLSLASARKVKGKLGITYEGKGPELKDEDSPEKFEVTGRLRIQCCCVEVDAYNRPSKCDYEATPLQWKISGVSRDLIWENKAQIKTCGGKKADVQMKSIEPKGLPGPKPDKK